MGGQQNSKKGRGEISQASFCVLFEMKAIFLTNFRALSSVLNVPSHFVSPCGDALITTYIFMFFSLSIPLP